MNVYSEEPSMDVDSEESSSQPTQSSNGRINNSGRKRIIGIMG